MKTLADLQMWALSAPHGTMIPADVVAAALGHLEVPPAPTPFAADEPALPWRVLFWTCPPEVRIGRDELLEAVGRPASWLYRHTGPAAEDRIPHRKLDGQLQFVVGEVRHWVREREEILGAGPVDLPLTRFNRTKHGA